MTVNPAQRFSATRPCPVCSGSVKDKRGIRRRCHGFISEDELWAHCSREEYASGCTFHEESSTFSHYLGGECRCGETHDEAPEPKVSTNGHSRQVAAYDYLDEEGKLLYQTIRYSDKSFKARRPNGTGGWVGNIEGIRRVLYCLPELLAADPAQWVFVCEGEKDTRNLRGLGLSATCNPFGAGKWATEYNGALEGRRVAVLEDNDDDGRKHCRKVANSLSGTASLVKVLSLPGLAEHGDVSDWLELGHTVDDLLVEVEQCPEWEFAEEEVEEPWPALGVVRERPSAPRMPERLLPRPLSAWIKDRADRAKLPLEMIAVPAITATGCAIGRRLGLQPFDYDYFYVVCNLWGAIIASSGALKSYCISEGTKPLSRLAEIAYTRYTAEVELNAVKVTRYKAEAKAIEQQMVTVAKGGKIPSGAGLDGLEVLLKAKLKSLAEATAKQKRYITQDATIEKLCELLVDNPQGMMVLRDELAGWLQTMAKAGREADRPFFLEAWNGTERYTTDRIVRGSINTPATCISLCGGIQPGKYKSYLQDALEGGEGDDGMLQRIQLEVWVDGLDDWVQPEGYPNQAVFEHVLEIFKWLDAIPEHINAGVVEVDHRDNDVPIITFNQEAQALVDLWRTDLENRVRGPQLESTPSFQSHLSKYRSLMPSLALIFHLLEAAEKSLETLETRIPEGVRENESEDKALETLETRIPEGVRENESEDKALETLETRIPEGTRDNFSKVGLESVKLAILWVEYLEMHARKVYADEVDPGMAAGHLLSIKISEGDIQDEESLNDISKYHHWKGLESAKQVRAGVKVLEEAGWVRIERRSTRGRPTDVIRLHPHFRIEVE
jgi:hypothetical protein